MEEVKKELNLNLIDDQLIKKGWSQSDLSKALEVSRATVSSWFKSEKYPRPRHVLKISEVLDIPFKDLVIKSMSGQRPAVAFRKSGNYKITEEIEQKYFHVARLLEKLVKYLPYDVMSAPPVLKAPQLDYDYIQAAAQIGRAHV